MFRSRFIVANALIFAMFVTGPARADVLPLDDALRATYSACVGIDDALVDLKKMAGINTAVTAVGTAAGAGATAVGLVKASKDRELDRLIKELREISKGQAEATAEQKQAFLVEFQRTWDAAVKDQAATRSKIQDLNAQSKKLGNWRTGLIAGSTVTNVAAAVIAGTAQSGDDLRPMVNACVSATDNLRQSINAAQVAGTDVTEARQILDACDGYNYVDLGKIGNRAKGAMISSIVGATTGAAGTVTSAMANSNAVRGDVYTESSKKEKNLNTAANVLSGATTAASATATVFNATQIGAIKKVATVTEKCTGALR